MVWDWQRVSVSVVCELAMSISLRLCFFGHRHRMQTVIVASMLIDLHGSSRTFWLYGLHICWPLARRRKHGFSNSCGSAPKRDIYEQEGCGPRSRYHRRCMSTCTADGKAQYHRRCMTPSACYVVFFWSHWRWILSHRRCMLASRVACDIHCHSGMLGSVRVHLFAFKTSPRRQS